MDIDPNGFSRKLKKMNYNSTELNRIWNEAKKIADESNMVFIGLENNEFREY